MCFILSILNIHINHSPFSPPLLLFFFFCSLFRRHTTYAVMGRSNNNTTSFVRPASLLTNASTTASHLLAFITSNMLTCQLIPPLNDMAVVITPSPRGSPNVHRLAYRSTSPALSHPGAPSLVHVAKLFAGETSNPNGIARRTSMICEGVSFGYMDFEFHSRDQSLAAR